MSDTHQRGSRAIEEAIKAGDERSNKKGGVAQRRNQRNDNRNQPPRNKQHPRSLVPSSEKQVGAIDDDLSNHFFLSDPSMSEEGQDSSSSSSDNHRSQSLSGESSRSAEAPQVDQSRTHPPPIPVTNPLLGRAPILNANSAGIYSSSPGNTSLSSWGSPHTRRQVQLSFSPERSSVIGPQQRQLEQSGRSANIPAAVNHSDHNNNINRGTPDSAIPFQPNLDVSDGHQYNNMSSNSTSEASLNQQQQAQDFLDNLRQQSRGAMVMDQPGLSSLTSFATSSQGADSYHHQIEGIMRHTQTYDADLEEQDDSDEGGKDDTVIMTLSVSEDERDSFDSSMLNSEQSHSDLHRSWMNDVTSQSANLQTVEEGITFEPRNFEEDYNDQGAAHGKHQMATGEPTSVGPADSRRGQHAATRSRLPGAETSNNGQQQHSSGEDRNLYESGSEGFDNMEAGDSSEGETQPPNYPWVDRYGGGPDPSAMSESLFQQPSFGSFRTEANWTNTARSPSQMHHQRFASDPSLVPSSPNHQYTGITPDTWPMQGNKRVMPTSPSHQPPQYFVAPHGEIMQPDPALMPHSPNLQPQYFITPQGEMVQADPILMPCSPIQQPRYLIPSQGEMLQANPTMMASSSHHQPQYFIGPQGELVDPTMMPGSPKMRPQYFMTPQGEMLQTEQALMAPSPSQPPRYLAQQGELSMPSYSDECDGDHGSEDSGSSETDGGNEDDLTGDDFMSVQQNRIWMGPNVPDLQEAEKLLENPEFRGKMQHMMRRHSVFANVGQTPDPVDRSFFMPKTSTLDDDPKCATFTCPRCKMKQREFFSVSSAPQQFETATSYLGLYFGVYVIASLFIFGLKEGWSALDCIYFAVITLTTAGLGDFTPTSDDAKIICSIFIYFGVACIGLLLGSYIAGMLDDMSHREATENRIKSCPNCARIQHLKELAKQNGLANQRRCLSTRPVDARFVKNLNDINKNVANRRQSFSVRPSMAVPTPGNKAPVTASANDLPAIFEGAQKPLNKTWSAPVDAAKESHNEAGCRREGDCIVNQHGQRPDDCSESGSSSDDSSEDQDVEMARTLRAANQYASPQVSQTNKALPEQHPATPPDVPASPNLLGSPLTREIMGRQHHTRHISFDASATSSTRKSVNSSGRYRQFSGDQNFWRNMSVPQPEPVAPVQPPPDPEPSVEDQTESDDDSEGSEDDSDDTVCEEGTTSSDESFIEKGDSAVQNARYVFLTLKEALVNSLLIIAVGSMGFFLIEGFTAVDSWYFTTSLLTTVGYGDICPVTSGGKLFATIYILVGGTILVNNMSMISMIPLELRKRRIERAVLTQFGDQLDDAALRELATGPLVQRLRLTPTRMDGLDECTREMFALAMLVRLGKVSEQDIKETFKAFRRLDVNNDGVLTSKSIIAGMIQKRRAAMMQVPSQIGVNPSPQGAAPAGVAQANNGVRSFTKGWLGPRGSFHALSQGGNSERTSLLTDSAIYDSISTHHTGTARG